MTCCDHCADSESLFSARTARRDLKKYRRRGMRPSTRMLVEALREDAPGATLLDIGGGVGAVQHELFAAGLASSTQVDASQAYLAASREEAERRSHSESSTYRYADFVEIAEELPPADLVSLDRVICCYPDVDRLVTLSAAKAKQVYAVVIPRDRWFVRVMLAMGNTFFWLRRSAFRTYIHPREQIDAIVRRSGFEKVFAGETVMWRVVSYRRVGRGD